MSSTLNVLQHYYVKFECNIKAVTDLSLTQSKNVHICIHHMYTLIKTKPILANSFPKTKVILFV